MVNEIIEGISSALDSKFNGQGTTYTIYTDNVKQGLDAPCFLITIVGPNQSNLIGGRYNGICPACIQYFPETYGDNTELHTVGEKLFDSLENITLISGIKVRGTDRHYDIADGVLSFFADYSVQMSTGINQDGMAGATVNTGLKRGV